MVDSAMQALAQQILAGQRRALAKGITLVESTKAVHRLDAAALLSNVMSATGGALRIGISGAPGVGKSTFIEALGRYLTRLGHKVAVLAVDPTSAVTGGSILGDKTRMPDLSVNPNAFVRPSPAGRTLGGVTRRTRESMLLCEAAGFDVVLIETVGVGQSETAVSDMTDLFLLLLSPGGGDDLQGIKRGIMELADLVLVNKSDGPQALISQQTVADYRAALTFMRARFKAIKPEVQACSALEGVGIETAWSTLVGFTEKLTESGEGQQLRMTQSKAWMWGETAEILLEELKQSTAVRAAVTRLEDQVGAGEVPATAAAQSLVDLYRKRD
ncbi:methylmalonyl Co-A mutase-associated GTPase MeaB [Pseudomonadales bacterium]|nr:methylmalonyl Co-A mutase-associated GTPase MeaB [Pseudomonadales bacterium]MDC3357579.1 methylmalonyl Co-A mutase-associated GTPase MeaB [Pseudomonadales bacterium]MDC3365145.1 methylmalonyl Co-A mutase-associated GTPase MeaB [Pseudomonadales bacterium]